MQVSLGCQNTENGKEENMKIKEPTLASITTEVALCLNPPNSVSVCHIDSINLWPSVIATTNITTKTV